MKSLKDHVKNITLLWYLIVIFGVMGTFVYYSALIKYKESEKTLLILLDELKSKLSFVVENESILADLLLNQYVLGQRDVFDENREKFRWYALTEDDVIEDTNNSKLQIGGIFSPKINWENDRGFGTLSILGRDYFVVATRNGSKTLYLAMDFSDIGKIIPSFFADVYIVSTAGEIIGGENNALNGLSVACLGIDMELLKEASKTGEIKRGFRDFSSRFEPHGFYIMSVYDKTELLKEIISELSPYIIGISIGLMVFALLMSRISIRAIMNPLNRMVLDINEGNIPIETEYVEFESVSNALEELIIRLKSIYQGLRFTATLEFDVDLNDPEVEIKTMKKFELSLPMVFRKYRAVAYYSVTDDRLELITTGGYFDRMEEMLESVGKREIPLSKITPLLKENPLTAIWMSLRRHSGHLLMIPLYVEKELRYVVMIYMDGIVSKTETEAGEILVLEYNLILDQIDILRKLNTIATTDFLTGLKNRMYFMSRLEEECERAKRYGIGPKAFGVSMLDLDGLKRVNDTFGHEAGDEYIKTFADYIQKVIRKSDVAGRLGGDEFGILWVNVDEEDLKTVEKRLVEGMKDLRTPKYGIKVSASVGSALYGVDGTTPDELLNSADMRMYAVKEKRRVGRR